MYLYYYIGQRLFGIPCQFSLTMVMLFRSSSASSSECRPRPYLTWRRSVTVSPAPNSYRKFSTTTRLHLYAANLQVQCL